MVLPGLAFRTDKGMDEFSFLQLGIHNHAHREKGTHNCSIVFALTIGILGVHMLIGLIDYDAL